MHPKKGIDILLQAFSDLQKDHGSLSGYTLQIAGDGDPAYVNSLKLSSDSLGVGDSVEWLGGVYDDRKWALYREADLFILPTHSENFGIVVAEALASGTPVLTTKGTPWNVLNEKQCGWCVDVSLDAIKSALLSFVNTDESDLQQMGIRGRRLVEENFDIQGIAGDFVKMYESICC